MVLCLGGSGIREGGPGRVRVGRGPLHLGVHLFGAEAGALSAPPLRLISSSGQWKGDIPYLRSPWHTAAKRVLPVHPR